MLKDTDDRLLCPECGGELWVDTNEYYSNPAFHDPEANDGINYKIATERGTTGIDYVELWCFRCRWNTDDVDGYMEKRHDSE